MQEAIFSCLSLSKKVHASSSSGYHDIQVLESISFTLLEGNFYCLLGASGSGKTSLLQIIALLDQSFSGSCKLFGTDVSSMSDNQMTLVRRCDIGFVYQFHHLMYDFNVFENVAFPLKLGGHNNSEIEHRVYDILSEIGMRNMAMTKIGALSGGERQRVAIARAVVHQPRLLILDEPTGNLDAKTGEKVIELLLYMKAKFKSTIIMATHNVRHAEIANRIMHIENGELLH